MMIADDFEADCASCAALCCVAPAFDRSDMFAIDKPAGVACPHLAAAGMCKIHLDLVGEGFQGCVQYSCLGAGQKVVQGVFDGQSWQDVPELLVPMLEAFRIMRQVQEWLSMLAEAEKLPLDDEQRRGLAKLSGKLQPSSGWTETSLQALEQGGVGRDIGRFLAGLKGIAARPG